MPTVITANRLGDGVVVFLDASGAWTEDFHRAAALADGAATAEALALAERSEAANEVIGPYAIEIESRNGHFVPKALREAIRASGPTVRRDLGKQAHGQAPSIVQRASVETSHVSL
jgi:sulfite reductase (NADPH) hemoprotein beta-component